MQLLQPQSVVRVLGALLADEKRTILLASSSGILAGLGGALLLAMVNRAIEIPLDSKGILHFFVVLIVTLLAGLTSQFLLIGISQKSVHSLRIKLTRIILGADLRRVELMGGHRLLATLTHDVRSISQTMTVFPGLLVDFATIVACFTYLAWLSTFAFSMTLLALLACVWLVLLATRRARDLFTVARDEEDTLIGHFKSATDGIKELKLNRLRRARFLDNDLEGSASLLRRLQVRAMRLFAVTDVLSQFTLFVVLGLIVMVLPSFLEVTPSLVTSFALTMTFLTMPFQNLLHRLPDLLRGAVAIGKLDRMKLALLEHKESTSAKTLVNVDHPERTISRGCLVELDQVTYGYRCAGEGPGFNLGPVTMRLRPGQITYLTGGNGSGKSTVAKLISGLYVPNNGRVRLDGQIIEPSQREWYRQHFSAVFADFHLFDRCLERDGRHRDSEVRHYLKVLGLDKKVTVEEGRLSTLQLSQGQRKRLALLGAWLEDRPVHVFDEWAADQEPEFRETFYHQILPTLQEQGKTVLVITHDDRYFHLADQLLKLDYGQVESSSLSVAV